MRIAILGCVALMGCMPTQEPAAPLPDEADCGADFYADLIGEPERNHTFEERDPPTRIIYPNTAITQDYRPDRLNVDVNIDGDIARLWCG